MSQTEYEFEHPMENRYNAGHGQSIASDSMGSDNSDHSGNRLSQSGDNEFVGLPPRLEKHLGIIT